MKNSIKPKMILGVGINDADYPVTISAVIDGKKKQLWVCPFYRAWSHMLTRCYSSKYQASKPTYIGCSVIPEWHSFSVFRIWMLGQDHDGRQLDKDLLVPGNKVYGPDLCIFVPIRLNLFANDNSASRGGLPIGVRWSKGSEKFAARCCNPFTGKEEYLGLFTCPNAAHEAWRRRKHELACQYADMQTDQRIAQALRTRYSKGAEI